MKYFYSEMRRTDMWRNIVNKDPVSFMYGYLWEKYKVYDADQAGEDIYEFVIKLDDGTEKKYKWHHEWWISYDPEWDINNNFYYEEVENVNFDYPKEDRDWIDVNKTKYAHAKPIWPPKT